MSLKKGLLVAWGVSVPMLALAGATSGVVEAARDNRWTESTRRFQAVDTAIHRGLGGFFIGLTLPVFAPLAALYFGIRANEKRKEGLARSVAKEHGS
jgi:hypothetical protein